MAWVHFYAENQQIIIKDFNILNVVFTIKELLERKSLYLEEIKVSAELQQSHKEEEIEAPGNRINLIWLQQILLRSSHQSKWLYWGERTKQTLRTCSHHTSKANNLTRTASHFIRSTRVSYRRNSSEYIMYSEQSRLKAEIGGPAAHVFWGEGHAAGVTKPGNHKVISTDGPCTERIKPYGSLLPEVHGSLF